MTRQLFAILLVTSLAACSGGGAGSAPTGAATAAASGPISAVAHSTVAATAPAGLAAGGTTVDLSAAANVEAIGKDGVAVGNGGIDGLGDAYSATLLGASVDWSGAHFILGTPGALDAVSGATVTLPAGHFTWLNILATAVNGNQRGQSFVVSYTDGTSATLTQSLSDWYSAQSYTGESTVLTEAHRLYANGTADDRPFDLSGYRLALDPSKVVESVKLPANRDVVVLALNLTAAATPVSLGKAANVEAIDANGKASLGGGLDGRGNAYSSSLLGPQAAWSGVSFSLGGAGTLGASSNATLTVPAGAYSAMVLLATGVNGSQPNQHFVVTYSDGTTATLTQSFSDWHAPQNYAGESIAFTEAYRNNSLDGRDAGPYYVYGYSLALDAGKSVQSVTLPKNRDVVVLAVDLLPVAPASGGTGTTTPAAVSISGAPSTAAVAGTAYAFMPSVTAAAGSVLTFSIQHAPSWAAFDSTDGSLSGTPAAADVGTFADIIIGVSDGHTSAQLAPFSLTVAESTSGKAAISWVAPTANTDGTQLNELAGYRIYYGQSAGSMTRVIQVAGADILSYGVTGLSPGTWYFSVEAYTSTGESSGPSATGSETIG